ncbi:serine hydrolase [Occallatibacter riparius]|uniref:Class A beta-lactamase-related serine hydrolase n=1 Tax=Occallatibacter riparius TaxID=1002689 RepID=A0A9J7BR43_9BACT|nr:serine hydrolase [Occallatibacter riparius]UWZ85049.1 class A beta-lactamase-related serine hydrolase [Occallatibacter riparius]
MHKRMVWLPLFLVTLVVFSAMGRAQEDAALDAQLKDLAAKHEGKVTLFARDLKTGQTASLDADEPVKTASTIKMGILLDAAEQIRSGKATLNEKLVLQHANQVEGSGVLAQLDTPVALTLKDVLTLMVVLSDNTATNMAIDRLGLDHINHTLKAAGLKQTYLYKKVYMPASGPMPADQSKFGLGKTTAREMASIMQRIAECRLDLAGGPPVNKDGPICGAIIHMLRNQQDRDGIPRYLESLDTSEHGSAIANKTGALDAVRNDVALISTKTGPVVIASFTYDNKDERWTGDNQGEQMIGKLAEAVVKKWSPTGLDANGFSWENPLAGNRH